MQPALPVTIRNCSCPVRDRLKELFSNLGTKVQIWSIGADNYSGSTEKNRISRCKMREIAFEWLLMITLKPGITKWFIIKTINVCSATLAVLLCHFLYIFCRFFIHFHHSRIWTRRGDFLLILCILSLAILVPFDQ